jgi:TonB-linked SusC/RagA family outer membrane protein
MKKKLLLFAVMLTTALAAFAQPRQITGKVADANGEPLIGVGIIVRGTTTGTMTDVDGNFALSVPADAVLEISSIGYVSQAIPVGNQTRFDIVLEEDSEMLEETVVIGYGTVKRENFTGSVATVKVGDSPISNAPKTNPMDLLRGMTTGVQISQSGVAGASPSMQVRGQKSISGGSMPLIILDGVVFKGSLMDIDPDTIESMSVMKDATSLAAYGSKAANGVIMITLKKGQEGKPIINFSTSQQLSTRSYRQRFLSPENYIKFSNARKGSDDLTNTSWMSFLEKANYEAGKTTDWYDLATRIGHTQNYNLNFSGRTQNSNYYVALGRSQQKGMTVGNEFTRNNVSMNLTSKVTKSIEVGTNMAFTNSFDDSVAASLSYKNSPYMEPYLPDGKTLRYYVEGVTGGAVKG